MHVVHVIPVHTHTRAQRARANAYLRKTNGRTRTVTHLRAHTTHTQILICTGLCEGFWVKACRERGVTPHALKPLTLNPTRILSTLNPKSQTFLS